MIARDIGNPEFMSELVQSWLAYQRTDDKELFWAFDLIWESAADNPNATFEFVLAVLRTRPEPKILAVLAAGPLEDVLAKNGPAIIARVEEESRHSPEFRNLLGGVWKNTMSDDVWQRVLKAAPNRW